MKKAIATLLVLVLITLAGCTTTEKGAAVGGVIGAGTGAIIGHQSGKTGTGALIGGAAGLIGGALIGNAIDDEDEEDEEE